VAHDQPTMPTGFIQPGEDWEISRGAGAVAEKLVRDMQGAHSADPFPFMTAHACSGCAFYSNPGRARAECHAKAPTGKGFPTVSADCWCGDFVTRPVT